MPVPPAGSVAATYDVASGRVRFMAMSDYRGELSGTVELGSLISCGALDVPRVLGDFHRNYPFVRIRLRQSQTGSMTYLSAIADGSLDLALVSAPERFPAGIEMRLRCRFWRDPTQGPRSVSTAC